MWSLSLEAATLPLHVKSITSTSNPFVKHCVKLRNNASYRHSHRSLLLLGTTPIREIHKFQESMQEKPNTIDYLFLHDEAEVPQELVGAGVRVVRVNTPVMKKLCGMQSTESMEAVSLVRIPSTFRSLDDNCQQEDFVRWFPSAFRILVLDGIQDPGNLGTLVRSAVAFGWDGVFLLPGCCDPFNEKAVRGSRGACFQIPIVCGGWRHLRSLVDGFQMKSLGAHPGAGSKTLSFDGVSCLKDRKLCVVLGSEGKGLSEKSIENVSELVSIRMAGEYESLNVSVAGGILLYMLQPQSQSKRFA